MTQFSIDNFFDDLGSKNKTSDSKDLSFKKVYIIFKTDSIGDTLAWIPYVEEFRKKHNCKIVCATYYNNWFKNEYKDIEFVEIGGDKRNPIYPVIDNVHDTYEISYLSHPIWVENLKNPELKGKVIPSLQQLITDILDLEHKEIKPKVSIPNKERDIKEKYVCMAIQSTAQCKYWNCKDGWNEIVRYLKSFGYKVVCIDKSSSFGIEGQYNLMPKGVIDKTGNIPLEERMVTLKYADFLISISSGLSWLSWSVGTPVIMVSSFTKPFFEFQSNNIRVYKEHSNSGFYNTHRIDPWNWNWNPIKECKTLDDWNEFEPITLQQVKSAVDEMIVKTTVDETRVETDIKKAYIQFGSSPLGDSIGWIPYCLEYKKKFNVTEVVVSTYWNSLFESVYPELTFVEPGEQVNNVDKKHTIDFYGLNLEEKDLFDNPLPLKDYKECSIQGQATNCLGLEHKEIRPRIAIPDKPRSIKGKYVCIATQTTGQCRYWNLKGGWDAIVRYLRKNGYKVVCIDKYSSFGIEGQYNLMPKGVIDRTGCTIPEAISLLKYSEFHVGISTGLSWVAWALGKDVVVVSGFTNKETEFYTPYRVINENVCNSCFNNHQFDSTDWNWCPEHKGTEREFECSKQITFQMVKEKIDNIIKPGIKRVYIQFESDSLGDSIAWVPYCIEYKKKFNVTEVVVSTYWNNLFKSVYPELTFVEPGELVNNVDKKHTVNFTGLNMFSTNTELLNNSRSLKNYKECGVQGQAIICLGLKYKEIKPRIVIPDKPRSIKEKYVCIAIQTTNQAKYWNLKNGWDDIIKYLKKMGYKVVCIDKYSSFGIEGQYNLIPKEVIDKTGDFPIEDRIVDINHAEFFIGTSSGLAWVAHAVGTPVVMISGFTKPWNEFTTNIERVHNDKVCNGCWHTHEFNPGDWNFCPENKDFECSKQISFNMVKDAVNNIIKKGI